MTRAARDHGPVARLRMFDRELLLLTNPADIEQVLVRDSGSYIKDKFTHDLSRALGNGLVTSEGAHWKRQRKLMAFAFTPKKIAAYADTMAQVAAHESTSWAPGQVVNLHQEMSRITLEIVAKVLFQADIEADARVVEDSMAVLNHFFAESIEAALRLPPWVPTPANVRLNRAVRRIDQLLFKIIKQRRKALDSGQDLLGAMLTAKDDSERGMSDQELRDECITLFIAGHETTALALTHCLYLLARNRSVRERFHAELDTVLGGRLPSAEDTKALELTERIIKESMRVYPPVWVIGREAIRDVELGGYTVKRGTQLILPQWVVHRDPGYFPNPEEFDPDRFLPERCKDWPRFAYFPFGGGPRVCVGNHFAMMEATLLLALFGQRFHFELEAGQRLEFRPSVTLRPKGDGVRAKLLVRS
jgi:cytochrome P450